MLQLASRSQGFGLNENRSRSRLILSANLARRPHLPRTGGHSLGRRLAGPPSRGSTLRANATKQKFSSFEDLIQSSKTPVLVDFYATWCGPCQMMNAVLSDVSAQLGGAIKVVKIDSDKYANIASRFNVQGLPTLLLFKNGQPVDRIEGFLAAPDLLARLKYFLAQPSS